MRPLGIDHVRKLAESMEMETRQFYEAAMQRTTDAGVRELLGDLADEERAHTHIAEELEAEQLTAGVRKEEEEARRRLFVLQVVQPGLAGLMDGSVSTLAPLFAAAFATHISATPSASAWPPRSARASAWDSPKRCPMTAHSPAAATRGCAASSAA